MTELRRVILNSLTIQGLYPSEEEATKLELALKLFIAQQKEIMVNDGFYNKWLKTSLDLFYHRIFGGDS